MTEPASSCPWSWHGLPCALERAHPSPHHIVGEQPRFAAIEAEAAQRERERLLREHLAHLHGIPIDRVGPFTYASCSTCLIFFPPEQP